MKVRTLLKFTIEINKLLIKECKSPVIIQKRGPSKLESTESSGMDYGSVGASSPYAQPPQPKKKKSSQIDPTTSTTTAFDIFQSKQRCRVMCMFESNVSNAESS